MIDRQLHVDSELTFAVDSPAGASTGTVQASGSRVTVRTSDPVAVMGAVMDAGGASSASAVGPLLADLGLTVDVVGPRGLVVSMGAGVESANGALVSGTRHVRFGSARSVGPLALARIRRPDVGRPVTIGAVALVALVVELARRRLARRTS